jgi:hypothetical protein
MNSITYHAFASTATTSPPCAKNCFFHGDERKYHCLGPNGTPEGIGNSCIEAQIDLHSKMGQKSIPVTPKKTISPQHFVSKPHKSIHHVIHGSTIQNQHIVSSNPIKNKGNNFVATKTVTGHSGTGDTSNPDQPSGVQQFFDQASKSVGGELNKLSKEGEGAVNSIKGLLHAGSDDSKKKAVSTTTTTKAKSTAQQIIDSKGHPTDFNNINLTHNVLPASTGTRNVIQQILDNKGKVTDPSKPSPHKIPSPAHPTSLTIPAPKTTGLGDGGTSSVPMVDPTPPPQDQKKPDGSMGMTGTLIIGGVAIIAVIAILKLL